ncbi:hypothetical protein BGZ94_001332 [Podila epigama]|nr:hypothetical protein BGZ94_001332 [Podila epigama]
MAHHAVSRPLSASTNSMCKSVQFSRFIKISFTYPEDEYDRTALEPAKLTFSEASELMQLRSNWKQEMKKRLDAERRSSMDCDGDSSEDGCVPDAAPSNANSTSGSNSNARSRHHTASLCDSDADQDQSAVQPSYPLLSSSSSRLQSSRSAPASSLSLQDACSHMHSHNQLASCKSSNSSLGSGCSSPCDGHYLDKLPHKKNMMTSSGAGGMMHRHSQLHRSKDDDMQCLA